jgi:hypothetical protein
MVEIFRFLSWAISSRESHIFIYSRVSSWVDDFFVDLLDFSHIFCFSRTPPKRMIASSHFFDFSDSVMSQIFSLAFSDVALSTRSYSMTRGSIVRDISLYPRRVSHSRERTRESATYPCPGTKASERSMTAESSVIP